MCRFVVILYYITLIYAHAVGATMSKQKNKSDDFSSLFDVILFLCTVFGFKAQFLVENCFSETN